MHDSDASGRAIPGRVRRRDRHGRGLRGSLVPPDVPLYRSRSDRFDDLVLLAVSQLEPRWEAELSGVEFGVEEIPPVIPNIDDPEPVPLARLDAGPVQQAPSRPGPIQPGSSGPVPAQPRGAERAGPPGPPDRAAVPASPARIVLYRRPLMARADGEEELAELVLDVIVEQFARWLGVDPRTVDPGYPAEE
jgi:hypothetical protein